LPREDIDALGISHRRIPILAAGRDIYFDTRLIIKKLEEWYPDGSLGAKTGDHKALETLLQQWTDATVFANASVLIPTNTPLLNDARFIKDREEFSGRSWSKENIEKMVPAALAEVVAAFQFLESTLLADGRQWLLGTEKASLADIEVMLPYHWLLGLEGALPPSHISENRFPKVFAWIKRFDDALSAAKSGAPKPTTLKGADALKQITGADFVETEVSVDSNDPLGLEPGENIEVWPSDTGMNHRDQGRLVGLTSDEVVLECQTKMAEKVVRIHAPRRGFRIRRTTGEAGARL
jgi:glutathione S-transferase